MGQVIYVKFIGARVAQEAKDRSLGLTRPLVLTRRDLVIDCEARAWASGVRPGDTIRQARLSSPACHILRAQGEDSEARLTDILDVLARYSPYVEPSTEETLPGQDGVFVDISADVDPARLLDSLNGMYFKAIASISGSKLVSRAACGVFLDECLAGGKKVRGKTRWGSVAEKAGCVLVSVDKGKEAYFLSGTSIRSLWMAPAEVLASIQSLGIKKVKDLESISLRDLTNRVGDWGVLLKRWARGEDRSKVLPLYPPQVIEESENFVMPVPLRTELFERAIGSLASHLIDQGVGFKVFRLSISDDRPSVGDMEGERSFVRPVSSLSVMQEAIYAILNDGGFAKSDPSISGFKISLGDISASSVKPIPLLPEGMAEPRLRVSSALDATLFGLSGKYGERAVAWGRSSVVAKNHNPEIERRERMLAMWDPMRAQDPYAAGGAADV